MAKQKSYFIDPAKDKEELKGRKDIASRVKDLADSRNPGSGAGDALPLLGYDKGEMSRVADGIKKDAQRFGVPQNALSNMFRQSLADLRKANPSTTSVAPTSGKDVEGRLVSVLDSGGEPVSPIDGKPDQPAPYSGFTSRMNPPAGAPQPESPTGLVSRMGPSTPIKKDQRVSNSMILKNLLDRAKKKRDKEDELVNRATRTVKEEMDTGKKVDSEEDDEEEDDEEEGE